MAQEGPTPTTSYMSNILQIMNSLQHNTGIIKKELLSATKYQTRKPVAESFSYVREGVIQPCRVNVAPYSGIRGTYKYE